MGVERWFDVFNEEHLVYQAVQLASAFLYDFEKVADLCSFVFMVRVKVSSDGRITMFTNALM